MDGFLKEDFVGTVRKGMTMEQIDNMVQRQLRMMQEDYDRCQKYEDPTYQGGEVTLQGKFEAKEFEDGTQFKDDKDSVDNKKQNENHKSDEAANANEDEKDSKNPQQVKNDDEQDDSDEDNDNRCVEDYYQPLDNDANDNEEDEEEDEQWSDFQKVEDFKELPAEKDPRKKEIDYEKIRQIMSSFTLQPPSWASDKNAWEQKVQGLMNDIQN